jgi:hypothetical protein
MVILAYFIFKAVNDLQLPAKIRCMRMGSAECLRKRKGEQKEGMLIKNTTADISADIQLLLRRSS